MIEQILTTIIVLGSFSLGYYMAKGDVSQTKETVQKTREIVEHVLHGKPDVGPVEAPDTRQLELLNNPKLAAEEEIMEQTLEAMVTRRV
jgi:hypothetical protein